MTGAPVTRSFLMHKLGLAALWMLLLAYPLYPLHPAAAMEFYSIKENGIVLYDAPSLRAGKLYVASQDLPVEVVVKVEGWVKVRDSSGSLAWVEEAGLSDKRHVIVTAPVSDVYEAPNDSSRVMFQAALGVILEWIEPAGVGWVRVRHRDGQEGYVRTIQVWGA